MIARKALFGRGIKGEPHMVDVRRIVFAVSNAGTR
jgi:hypothetical protein